MGKILDFESASCVNAFNMRQSDLIEGSLLLINGSSQILSILYKIYTNNGPKFWDFCSGII
jgi:hypothetical protein